MALGTERPIVRIVPELQRICRICQSAGENPTFTVREMQFGTRRTFEYFECLACGGLQIADIPENLADYYPSTYYSLQSRPIQNKDSAIRRFARKQHSRYAVTGHGLLGRILYWRHAEPGLRSLSLIRPHPSARILDVGCGNGERLHRLREIGFENLLGIDPFLRAPIQYDNGLRIEKMFLDEVQGQWDIVMFHHSLEHVPDPVSALQQARRLLTPGGFCLVRLPTTSSWAWRRYREHWGQLDAPRHLFLPSAKSMHVLAARTGFRVQRIVYDSNDFQFVGSEMYARNLPLHGPDSPKGRVFSKSAVALFRLRALLLNLRNDGDQFACVLAT